MATPFLQCRVDRETRARVEQAADDCGMPVGTWLREIVDSALLLHFGVEVESESEPGVVYRVTASGCSCPGFTNHGHCKHHDALMMGTEEDDGGESAPETESGEEYVERVRSSAGTPVVVDRVEHPGESSNGKPHDVRLTERDCPHLPQWWRATGRCRCGRRMGGRMGR